MIKRIVFLLLLCAALCADARNWVMSDGSQADGEITKFAKGYFIIKNAAGKFVKIEYDKLSEKDAAFLKSNYCQQLIKIGAIKSDLSEATVQKFDLNSDTQSKWKAAYPVIKLNKEDFAFIWDSSGKKFSSHSYSFVVKKKISQAEAVELAMRCQTTCAAVQSLPFLAKELFADASKIKRIEIAEISQKHISGLYKCFSDPSGNMVSGIVIVEPANLPKCNGKPIFGGTLAHELCHQMLEDFSYPMAITEGLAEFMALSIYFPDGTIRFDKLEKILKGRDIPRLMSTGNAPIKAPDLRTFYGMKQKTFYAPKNAARNYLLAQLLTIYFAQNMPDEFAKFVYASRSNVRDKESDICKKTQRNLKILTGANPKILEEKISDYFHEYGIDLTFDD